LFTVPAVAQEVEPLVLRLNDAVALPGGIAALTLRTYSSRGIGQGQVGMPVRDTNGNPVPSPIESLLGVQVYDVGDGGTFSAELDLSGPDPVLLLNFDSPAGTVNLRDGPLAVIYLRLTDSVMPNQEFDVLLDVAGTFLDDPDGAPIPVELRSGRLSITTAGAPFVLAAAAEPVTPGAVAFLSVQTAQLRLLSTGHVVFRYDPAIAAGPPVVYVDRRYGSALIDRSGSVPAAGIISVQFVSPAENLNRVVGDIITIRLPTLDTIPPGSISPIWLDPSQTLLVDRSGQVLTLSYEADLIRFR
jgi:hypothetical protein